MGPNIGAGFSHKRYASSDDAEKLGLLGEITVINGIPYKLVQVHTACVSDVIAAGHVLYKTSTENVVTNDRSEAVTDSAKHYAGIAPSDLIASVPESTATKTYYMLMQVGGRNSAVVTNGDDDIAAGDSIIASGDGTCDSTATPEGVDPCLLIGIAAADDVNASNTVAVDMRYVG